MGCILYELCALKAARFGVDRGVYMEPVMVPLKGSSTIVGLFVGDFEKGSMRALLQFELSEVCGSLSPQP